jgi:hypothetical protein
MWEEYHKNLLLLARNVKEHLLRTLEHKLYLSISSNGMETAHASDT